MSKKSLFYIAGGILLILLAGLTFVRSAVSFSTLAFGAFRRGGLSFQIFKDEFIMDIFMRDEMNFMSWANIVLLALAGIVLLVKAFMPDLIPSIALGGIFGLLALFALITLFKNFFNIFEIRGFKAIMRTLVYVFMNLLSVVAFGSMAAVIILKDSFGSLFFVPAAAAAFNAVVTFMMNIIGLFGAFQWGFGASIFFLFVDVTLVLALFAVGMANNEE